MKRSLTKLVTFGPEEEGSSLAEFAILVPFLLIMLAAVSEFGRYFQKYNSLAKATRAGARYLSNHPYDNAEQDKARNLVACGKLTCGTDRVIPGIQPSNVCVEYFYPAGSPKPETVTVRIPRTAGGCGAPVNFAPIFDIGALLNTSFTMALPIAPSTTMYYLVE